MSRSVPQSSIGVDQRQRCPSERDVQLAPPTVMPLLRLQHIPADSTGWVTAGLGATSRRYCAAICRCSADVRQAHAAVKCASSQRRGVTRHVEVSESFLATAVHLTCSVPLCMPLHHRGQRAQQWHHAAGTSLILSFSRILIPGMQVALVGVPCLSIQWRVTRRRLRSVCTMVCPLTPSFDRLQLHALS